MVKRVMMVFAALFLAVGMAAACGENGENGNDGNGNDGNGGATFCATECSDVSDCANEDDWACDDGACVPDTEPQCQEDSDCDNLARGWVTECTEGGDECAADTMECVNLDGTGYCATPPTNDECAGDTIKYEDEENMAGDTVTVCGTDENYECQDGACQDPEADPDPQCESDGDCDDVDNADTCYDGVCGCSSDETCDDSQVCAEF